MGTTALRYSGNTLNKRTNKGTSQNKNRIMLTKREHHYRTLQKSLIGSDIINTASYILNAYGVNHRANKIKIGTSGRVTVNVSLPKTKNPKIFIGLNAMDDFYKIK